MIYLKAIAIGVVFTIIDSALAVIGFVMFGDHGFNVGFHAMGSACSFVVAIMIARGQRWPDFKRLIMGP